jgi:hypothetical protein
VPAGEPGGGRRCGSKGASANAIPSTIPSAAAAAAAAAAASFLVHWYQPVRRVRNVPRRRLPGLLLQRARPARAPWPAQPRHLHVGRRRRLRVAAGWRRKLPGVAAGRAHADVAARGLSTLAVGSQPVLIPLEPGDQPAPTQQTASRDPKRVQHGAPVHARRGSLNDNRLELELAEQVVATLAYTRRTRAN